MATLEEIMCLGVTVRVHSLRETIEGEKDSKHWKSQVLRLIMQIGSAQQRAITDVAHARHISTQD